MSKKVKWGVLGFARIAQLSVIPAIKKANNSQFYGVASEMKKIKDMSKKFGCIKTYTSYDQLLDDPDIQAVYIPLPNSLHKKWTIKAAQKGKRMFYVKTNGTYNRRGSTNGECL